MHDILIDATIVRVGKRVQENTRKSVSALGPGKSFAIRYSCMQSAGDAYKD